MADNYRVRAAQVAGPDVPHADATKARLAGKWRRAPAQGEDAFLFVSFEHVRHNFTDMAALIMAWTQIRPSRLSYLWPLLCAIAFTLPVFCGCQNPSSSKNKGFASVEISGHSPERIQQIAVTVFREDGYRDIAPSPAEMVFEKEGTAMNHAAYGGWLDEKRVTVRVRSGVKPLPSGNQLLWCQAYMVGDAGDSLFEEEHKLTAMRKGPYQKLLNDVAARLK